MNTRSINAAARPETIRTSLNRLKEASERCRRIHRRRALDEGFSSHIQRFSSPSVCYASVNGISVAVPLC